MEPKVVHGSESETVLRVGARGWAALYLAAKLEKALAGQGTTADAIEKATTEAGTEVADVNADIHASEAYRRAMVGVFAKRAVLAAVARA